MHLFQSLMNPHMNPIFKQKKKIKKIQKIKIKMKIVCVAIIGKTVNETKFY